MPPGSVHAWESCGKDSSQLPSAQTFGTILGTLLSLRTPDLVFCTTALLWSNDLLILEPYKVLFVLTLDSAIILCSRKVQFGGNHIS